jgi:hypothetical protein
MTHYRRKSLRRKELRAARGQEIAYTRFSAPWTVSRRKSLPHKDFGVAPRERGSRQEKEGWKKYFLSATGRKNLPQKTQRTQKSKYVERNGHYSAALLRSLRLFAAISCVPSCGQTDSASQILPSCEYSPARYFRPLGVEAMRSQTATASPMIEIKEALCSS